MSLLKSEDTLPRVGQETVNELDALYARAIADGDEDAAKKLQTQLCWALVHSHRDENKLKGVAMLEALLPSAFTHEDKHECLYLIAVGLYRLRKLVDAKRVVTQALQEAPHSRQAEALRQLIDDAIMQDGLIGVGLVVGVAGLIGIGATAVASALSTSRRR
mmetsp:Transcript_1473/g.5067  ORF Transcript_1473/g.5067 Transcript_1473/m.5067 type:complete len:161 (-) Transcript_1473:555-1037(-)